MAIALDTSAKNKVNLTPHTSNSFAYTCTGSNLILIVNVTTDTGADPTSVTYNGVAMTKLTGVTDTARNLSVWYLVAPATGSNTLTANFASALSSVVSAQSYTGVAQSGPIDASGSVNNGSGQTVSKTITVVASNCWLIGAGHGVDNSSIQTLTSDKTDRQQDKCSAAPTIYHTSSDSNGTVSPGSNSITWSDSQNINMGGMCIVFSIKPPTVASSKFLLMF